MCIYVYVCVYIIVCVCICDLATLYDFIKKKIYWLRVKQMFAKQLANTKMWICERENNAIIHTTSY